jgi:hypothetical protein
MVYDLIFKSKEIALSMATGIDKVSRNFCKMPVPTGYLTVLSEFHHPECMGPLIPQQPGDAPQDAQRFNGSCSFGLSHVLRFPAEPVQDLFHFFF